MSKIKSTVAIALVAFLAACGSNSSTSTSTTTTVPTSGASSIAGMLCGDRGSLNWGSQEAGWWYEGGPVHPFAPGEYEAPKAEQDYCEQASAQMVKA